MSEQVRLELLDYFLKHYGELRRCLLRYLRHPELVEDSMQDTWLRLQRLDDQAPVGNPRGYLLRMSLNVAITQMRNQHRLVAQEEVDAIMELSDPIPGPEQSAISRLETERMLDIVRRMPQRRRDVLMLVRWEGMQQKDVARKLGVSLRTVELELRKANDYLAVRLGRNAE